MDNDHTQTRQQRRASERAERKKQDRAERARLLRRVAELVEGDASISSCTVISPNGTVDYVDADQLRKGGWA